AGRSGAATGSAAMGVADSVVSHRGCTAGSVCVDGSSGAVVVCEDASASSLIGTSVGGVVTASSNALAGVVASRSANGMASFAAGFVVVVSAAPTAPSASPAPTNGATATNTGTTINDIKMIITPLIALPLPMATTPSTSVISRIGATINHMPKPNPGTSAPAHANTSRIHAAAAAGFPGLFAGT